LHTRTLEITCLPQSKVRTHSDAITKKFTNQRWNTKIMKGKKQSKSNALIQLNLKITQKRIFFSNIENKGTNFSFIENK
jgi:hypothetical protein